MRRPHQRLFLLALVASLALASFTAFAAQEAKIPERPEKLSFGPLEFEVPKAEEYRHELDNGVVAYVAEDRALPLVTVGISLKIGSFLDPEGKEGLASMTGLMIRRGGGAGLSASEFDERADFLAANISTSTGDTGGSASMNCITPVLDECLDLFFGLLAEPAFDAERFGIEKAQRLEAMKQRNDEASDIQSREWQWLMRGREHFTSEYTTEASLEAVTRDDLVAFHRKYWHPGNMLVTVSGDVDTKEILAKLGKHFERLPSEGESVAWPPPAPEHTPTPGVYHVEKDIPQARVFIGHLGSQWESWDEADNYALEVMSFVFGGSGFTSRITKRIRSDEGLAYSAFGRYGIGTYWPGTFVVGFQTKSETVALASKIALEEMRKIREEPITALELETAKNYFIETFPQTFNSPAGTVGAFAQDEWLGRPHAYWQEYRERVRAVSAEDVQRVAKKYLHPDKLTFLIVGRWEEILPGDVDGRANMAELGGEEVVHLPLRDPLTLEPMEGGEAEKAAAASEEPVASRR